MATGMRTIQEMLYELTAAGDAISVSLASTDYTVVSTKQTKRLIVSGGTVVKIKKTNSDASTVDIILPSPGNYKLQDITKIYKTGTDATSIVLIVEPLI
jgi:hypothetical protein